MTDDEVTYQFPYRWRVKTKLPDRFGQFCRVKAWGKMNSCWVEFEDGYEVVTSRFFIRYRDAD